MDYQPNLASLLIMKNDSYKMEIVPLKFSPMRIGRGEYNPVDIKLDSEIVSDLHGIFYYSDNKWFFKDNISTNGTFIDGRHIINDPTPQFLEDGSVIRIDSAESESVKSSMTIVFCLGDYSNQNWTNFPLKHLLEDKVYIGRSPEECDIFIDSITLSKKHGVFYRQGEDIYYEDLKSTNGSFVNNLPIRKNYKLKNKDVFLFGNIKMIYSDGILFYTQPDSGTNLVIRDLTKEVNDSEHFGKRKTILSNVNLDVNASELVAVIGTSGAGKTTFLNCVNGYEEATRGSILINNIDLYKNKNVLKKQIGYVPQEDLLRDELSVKSTLDYIAKMRLPKDVRRNERQELIDKTLDMLGIERTLKSSKIRKLSGGQRKRISIATELISDPPIIFLDEPTSGLDPETESVLIKQLRRLSHGSNKMLIVITHTLKNIDLFDKVLFLGPGGKLCYYGTPFEALEAFGVKDLIDAYPLVRENTDFYAQRYLADFNKRL